jgi:hypothetical protein
VILCAEPAVVTACSASAGQNRIRAHIIAMNVFIFLFVFFFLAA